MPSTTFMNVNAGYTFTNSSYAALPPQHLVQPFGNIQSNPDSAYGSTVANGTTYFYGSPPPLASSMPFYPTDTTVSTAQHSNSTSKAEPPNENTTPIVFVKTVTTDTNLKSTVSSKSNQNFSTDEHDGPDQLNVKKIYQQKYSDSINEAGTDNSINASNIRNYNGRGRRRNDGHNMFVAQDQYNSRGRGRYTRNNTNTDENKFSSSRQQQYDEKQRGKTAAVAGAAAFMASVGNAEPQIPVRNGVSSNNFPYNYNEQHHRGGYNNYERRGRGGSGLNRGYPNPSDYSDSNEGYDRRCDDEHAGGSLGRGRRGGNGTNDRGNIVRGRGGGRGSNRSEGRGTVTNFPRDNNYQMDGSDAENNRRYNLQNGYRNYYGSGTQNNRNQVMRNYDNNNYQNRVNFHQTEKSCPNSDDASNNADKTGSCSNTNNRDRATRYRDDGPDRGKADTRASGLRRGIGLRRNVYSSSNAEDEITNQREELISELHRGTYECMVCCDRIKPQQAIWSCRTCFNCFHLGCIKKWANSSKEGGGLFKNAISKSYEVLRNRVYEFFSAGPKIFIFL